MSKQNSYPHSIEQQRVSLLFEAGSSMFMGGMVAIFAYAWVARAQIDQGHLKAWLVYMVAAFSFRVVCNVIFKKSTAGRSDFRWYRFERLHAAGLFLTASGWGIAASVLLPQNQDTILFLGFLIVALIAGGASTYAVSKLSTFTVMLPMAIPLSLALCLRGDNMNVAIGILIVLFTGLMIGSAFKRREFILQAWQLAAEKEQLSKDLIEAQARATRSAEMAAFGQMAAGIAHEINTPLAIVSLSAQSLQAEAELGAVSSDLVLEQAAQIESTVARIAAIISSLKVFTRSDQVDLAKEIDPNLLMQMVKSKEPKAPTFD